MTAGELIREHRDFKHFRDEIVRGAVMNDRVAPREARWTNSVLELPEMICVREAREMPPFLQRTLGRLRSRHPGAPYASAGWLTTRDRSLFPGRRGARILVLTR
jgi:hypothetical protein